MRLSIEGEVRNTHRAVCPAASVGVRVVHSVRRGVAIFELQRQRSRTARRVGVVVLANDDYIVARPVDSHRLAVTNNPCRRNTVVLTSLNDISP